MRIDKYEPLSGGFRAPLAANQVKTTGAVGSGATAAKGYGLDANGRAVVGAGNSGIKGVGVFTRDMKAGDIGDFMTDGEIVEFGGVAGTTYRCDNVTGVIEVGGAAAGKTVIGHTVEAARLVVRVGANG